MLMNVHTSTYITPGEGMRNKGLRQTMRVRGEAVEGGGLVGCHLAAIERMEGGQIVFTVRSIGNG